MKRKIYDKCLVLGIIVAFCLSIMAIVILGNNHEVQAHEDNSIIPYTRESGSGTRVTFNEAVGLENQNWLGACEDETSDKIGILASSEEMLIQISNTPDGLGYVSYAVAKDSEKAKMLSVDGVELTNENIKNETYPLTRSFYLVHQENLTELEKDFLQYVKSEGQGEITQYCVPARNRGIFLRREVQGELVISGSTSMTPMMRALAAAYMEINPKVTIKVSSSDSEAGMMNVISGNSNFGMVSRELKSYEKAIVASERVGRDAIAIVVNSENELEDISISQLRKIYN